MQLFQLDPSWTHGTPHGCPWRMGWGLDIWISVLPRIFKCNNPFRWYHLCTVIDVILGHSLADWSEDLVFLPSLDLTKLSLFQSLHRDSRLPKRLIGSERLARHKSSQEIRKGLQRLRDNRGSSRGSGLICQTSSRNL